MNTNSTLLISKCVGKSSNKLISIQKNTNLIHNLMTSSVKVALVPEPVWASFMTSSSGGVKNGTCSRTCLDKIDDVVLINTNLIHNLMTSSAKVSLVPEPAFLYY